MIHWLKFVFALIRVFLPEWLVRMLYLRRLPQVSGRQIDPKAQAVGDLVALARQAAGEQSVAESRKQLEKFVTLFDGLRPKRVTIRDFTLPGAEGDRAARLYLPSGCTEAAGPALLYLHGGGWIQGSIGSHDALCGKLAEQAGMRVISYDYRLAPEHPFPAAPNDVMAAYLGLREQAAGLGIDADRLAIGGDSAGANLSASVLHSLAASGGPMPAVQLLIYPGVDARLCSVSMQELSQSPLLPLERIRWYLDLYLPEGQDREAPEVSPLFSDRLTGQPQALILTAGQDPLWDDGQAYAASLQEAGVLVDLMAYPGQVHGFLNLTRVIPQGEDAVAGVALWLKARLSDPG